MLYRFTGGLDGANPAAGLIADAAGNLYGTTQRGGGFNSCSDCGTVFKVTPSGTETVLYRFTGLRDGKNPAVGLIADASGNLYGTTFAGGSSGCCGTVFKLTPSGNLTVLWRFTGGNDGANPAAGLIADAAGNLYGTTHSGGAGTSCVQGCGTVFELTLPAGLTGVPGRPNMITKRLGHGALRMGRR